MVSGLLPIRALNAGLLALVFLQAAPGQKPPPPKVGTGLVLGQVVDSDGAPVSNALVTLGGQVLGGGANALRVYSNHEGRFAFLDLPAGSFSLTVSKTGYSGGSYGRRRPNGLSQTLELADGERVGPSQIPIWAFASITGTLLDDAGEPLVGATMWSLQRVYTTGRPKWQDGPSAATDDRGYFRFAGLAPGDWTFCVLSAQSTMPASLVEGFAAARAEGTLEEFQRSYSSGTIGFSARLPTAGIRLGDNVLHTVGPYSGGLVPPAPDETGQIWSFPTTCHPNTLDLREAEVLTLTPGEERTGAALQLRLARGVTVEGTVMGPEGPVPNVGVRLAPSFSRDLAYEVTWESALTVSDARGRFTFLGVPPGSYTLRALKGPVAPAPATPGQVPRPSPDPTLSANVPIVVDADGLSNLTVMLVPGYRVSGRFRFEGTSTPPAAGSGSGLDITLVPADGHPTRDGSFQRLLRYPDGTFESQEIPPDRYYYLRPSSQSFQATWIIKAVLIGGRDMAHTAFGLTSPLTDVIVVWTDDPSELSGTVRDETGRADPAAGVVVFPVDPAEWLNFGDSPYKARQARVTTAGVFKMRALPPGQYFVVAVDEALLTEWQNPRFLEVLSRMADRVTIAEGEKKSVTLTAKAIK